jgi:4'-phosphopantetheinyl transferase
MNLVQTFNLNDVFIYCMEIDPELSEFMKKSLTENELNKYLSIQHPIKKLEFLGSRHLKHQLFGNQELYYDHTGAPYLEKQGYISLSHAYPHVVMAVCENHRIGVDIEPISEKAVRTAIRFTTEHEIAPLKFSTARDYTLLWSLKETLYKLSDRNSLLFQQHLLVKRCDNGLNGIFLNKDGFYKTTLDFLEFGGFLITCNTNRPEYVGDHLPKDQ